jgi:hypothetical protein
MALQRNSITILQADIQITTAELDAAWKELERSKKRASCQEDRAEKSRTTAKPAQHER